MLYLDASRKKTFGGNSYLYPAENSYETGLPYSGLV